MPLYINMEQANEKSEYVRIKRLMHKLPLLENDFLLQEIEDFGMKYDHSRLYSSLKRKYKWHRVYHPKNLPIGKPSAAWSNRQSPLVSVIVPNYCHAPYLRERIDCILNQTFENFEVILLDDCSKDESRDILLSYKDHPKVSHVVLNEQNTGNTFMQWEKGVSLAKGKYIWIAESDDYADESFLDSVMAVFSIHEDSVLVRTGSYLVNSIGRVMAKDWDIWREDETAHYYPGNKYIRHNMLHFNFIYNASMVVFRKDVFVRIDKSYQRLRYTGDWQCWIEMLQEGPVCEYRRKLNYFRQHENKVSAQSNKTSGGVTNQLRVMAYVINHLPLSAFRKAIVRGEHYQLVKMTHFQCAEERQEAWNILCNELRATKGDHMICKVLSFFDFLPFIPSLKNDKLK